MRERVLVDTDVLIDHLRGRAEAREYLEASARPIVVSALTVAELHVGVREGAEREALAALLGLFAEIVPLEATDAVRGGFYRRDYGRTHGTGLVDACLAAQAERIGAELVTLNARHFLMLSADALRVPYEKA